jgi:hypothetical protein
MKKNIAKFISAIMSEDYAIADRELKKVIDTKVQKRFAREYNKVVAETTRKTSK